MYKVKDAKNINPKLFPKPDYSHIGNGGVKVSDPIWIPFDQIKIIDPTTDNTDNEVSGGNRGRMNPIPSPSRRKRIFNSFAPGVLTSEYLPAVIKRNVDSSEPLQYELLYGIGRTLTFKDDLRANGYWYNLITATDTDLEWVCLNENEELEKTPSKEEDVVQSIARMLRNRTIKNDQYVIDKEIRKNLPFRRSESRARIVEKACATAGVPIRYVTYSDGSAYTWITDHSSVEYCIGGTLDPLCDMYGFLVKEGRVKDFFHKAIIRKYETGKSSYGIFHYDLPSEKSNFNDKAYKQFNYVEYCHNAYSKLGMDTRSFIHVKGSLPQDRKVNKNWKVLVKWPTRSLIAEALDVAA